METGSSPGCDLSPASIPLAFKRRAVCKKQSLPAIPAVGMFPDSSISRNAVGSESDILRKQLLTGFVAAVAVLLYGAAGSSREEQFLLVLDLVMIGVGLLFTGTGLSSLFMRRGRPIKSKRLDRLVD